MNRGRRPVLLVGIDLAWGEKKHDGVCFLQWDGRRGSVIGFAYPQGDRELLDAVLEKTREHSSVFVTMDAPIVCPNQIGRAHV